MPDAGAWAEPIRKGLGRVFGALLGRKAPDQLRCDRIDSLFQMLAAGINRHHDRQVNRGRKPRHEVIVGI